MGQFFVAANLFVKLKKIWVWKNCFKKPTKEIKRSFLSEPFQGSIHDLK